MSSQELNTYRLRGVLATVDNVRSKAMILESEAGGLSQFYTLLSLGKSIADLAYSLGTTVFDMEYILKRTPEHRKNYLNAMTSCLADSSVVKLKNYSKSDELGKEEAAGAKHHMAVVSMASKALNEQGDKSTDSKVIVNNTITIANRNAIPTMPDGLANIINIEEQDYVITDA